MAIKKILFPTDFSERAQQALKYTVELARPVRAEVIVLFVVEPVYYATPADLYGAAVNLSVLLEEQQRIGREQLTRVTDRLKKQGLRARFLLETGAPHQVIVDTAARIKANLIVMATHGRTGLAHLLLGSVTEKVVRAAACPVLTVRGRERAARGGGKPRAKTR